MSKRPAVTDGAEIAPCVLALRGQRVILDADLARIYGTTTKKLNQQVTRSRDRFPSDFVFRLRQDEKDELVTNCDRFINLKHSTALPRAFTEHGAIMVASVMSSPRAVEMSVFVVRAFVRFRSILARHQEFAERLTELESKIARHDESIRSIVTALRDLLHDGRKDRSHPIGFKPSQE